MNNIFKIIKLAKPQHKFIVVACLLITIQAALQQATPITLKFVVDELSAQITDGTGEYQQLVFLFVLILAINISGIMLNAVNQRLGDHIASRLGRHLTENFYRKIFTLPQKYFDSEISGKIVNQLNRGIIAIREFVGSATNFIMPAFLQAIFGIGVLWYYDTGIALLALSVFPVYIAISSYSTKKWGQIQEKKNIHEDTARGRIQEVIGNIKLVKTYNSQEGEWRYVSDKYQTINELYDRQSTRYHILNFIREFGLETAFVFILFIIFRKTFLLELTLGEMVLIIQLLSQLRWPLYGMSFILERVHRAEADSKAFFEILELPGNEEFQSAGLPPLLENPHIEFAHVDFAYEDGSPVLTDINMKCDKQETVALVGHSGAGKTTLVNLILKLYEPTSGELRLSDTIYADAPHAWIRAHIALVFQDNELFSSTIRENVAYGVPDASDEQIITALKQANAYDFVSRFKGGLDAKIGERGVKLSGGQKQRIQIARAILHDKPILILDEATSSLDSKSEHLVQDALEKLFQNRLVIIIAHRFSTIQNAHRIVVLDNGKIADAGTPQELAHREGIYSELLRYQVEGNKKLLSEYELR
ncbi:MAG: ABC transporter ATP-binding protein [Patescibacteria group bacterium]